MFRWRITSTFGGAACGLRRRVRHGFTLVELLVVVAIIALLVSILMPSLASARELTRKIICSTNLHTLGRGWQMYWNQWNYKSPRMFNPIAEDILSQWNYLIWAGDDGPHGNTTGLAQYMNAGVLYRTKFLASESAFVCPTTLKNNKGPWFNQNWPASPWWNNKWPVFRPYGTTMTYGTRRFRQCDDPEIANITNNGDTNRPNPTTTTPRYYPYMISVSGVGNIPNAAKFSYMADRFISPSMAMLSHVPGVNVQFLDGHVKYWEDKDQDVIYNNTLEGANWGAGNTNWIHDDIWMIIDGYHQGPVGQGRQ